MSDKIEIDLKGVPQTLLLPLIGRAKLSDTSFLPFHDQKSIEIANSLNYDFDRLLEVKNVKQTTLFWMARAYHFDEAIKAYLKLYPNAVIVNLGAGLDTAFNRVDNGQLTWIDIDLPEVIQLRKKILPPTNREHYIAKSVLDYSWMDDVKKYGDNVLFYAGGLFMYFTEEQVKSIFMTMAAQFPQSELIFDNISPKGLAHANQMIEKAGMKNALLQWSVYDGKELEAWAPTIRLQAQMPYFNGIKSTFWFPLSYKITMYFFDFIHRSGIIHLKFL